MENFQKQCFKWIFGTKTSYQQLLKNHSILPICHLIELRTFIFLSQLMNNKYQYDYRKFLVVNDSTNQRRICSFNFFKTNTLSSNLNSFFTRSAIMATYLFRHKIISGFQKSDETAVKTFLLNKTFSFDVVCTYYIVCTCSNCVLFKSISYFVFGFSMRIKSFSLSLPLFDILQQNEGQKSPKGHFFRFFGTM